MKKGVHLSLKKSIYISEKTNYNLFHTASSMQHNYYSNDFLTFNNSLIEMYNTKFQLNSITKENKMNVKMRDFFIIFKEGINTK